MVCGIVMWQGHLCGSSQWPGFVWWLSRFVQSYPINSMPCLGGLHSIHAYDLSSVWPRSYDTQISVGVSSLDSGPRCGRLRLRIDIVVAGLPLGFPGIPRRRPLGFWLHCLMVGVVPGTSFHAAPSSLTRLLIRRLSSGVQLSRLLAMLLVEFMFPSSSLRVD